MINSCCFVVRRRRGRREERRELGRLFTKMRDSSGERVGRLHLQRVEIRRRRVGDVLESRGRGVGDGMDSLGQAI